MASRFGLAIAGTLVAIAITATMDATGYTAFSALPLLPLGALLWWLERFPRREVGFAWGRWSHYGLALLYPVVVIGACALAAAAAGSVDLAKADWNKAWLNVALIAGVTVIVAMLTEEGFFRGWLWASLRRRGCSATRTLVWTSVAFALWHIPAVALHTELGFDLPPARIPMFIVNVAVIGAIWGMLRQISGSLVVTSVSHAVWNAFAYVMFGFGTKAGALGVEDSAIFGPEVGVVGLALNVLFAFGLHRLWRSATYRGSNAIDT